MSACSCAGRVGLGPVPAETGILAAEAQPMRTSVARSAAARAGFEMWMLMLTTMRPPRLRRPRQRAGARYCGGEEQQDRCPAPARKRAAVGLAGSCDAAAPVV